jgi:hypothetical protein
MKTPRQTPLISEKEFKRMGIQPEQLTKAVAQNKGLSIPLKLEDWELLMKKRDVLKDSIQVLIPDSVAEQVAQRVFLSPRHTNEFSIRVFRVLVPDEPPREDSEEIDNHLLPSLNIRVDPQDTKFRDMSELLVSLPPRKRFPTSEEFVFMRGIPKLGLNPNARYATKRGGNLIFMPGDPKHTSSDVICARLVEDVPQK